MSPEERQAVWEQIVNHVTDGGWRLAARTCYICGDGLDHNGERHGVVTGDGRDRLAFVTGGRL